LLASFYSRFIQRLGFYLIEMNSGRLRGGADAYRRAFPAESRELAPRCAGATASDASQPLTVALVGQVSSGKSSLVNALLGSHQAAVDILPETKAVERYQTTLGDPAVTVTLLDTPGYGEAGATADQSRQIRSALQQSNAVLVVMDAHSPAREADRRTIDELKTWYAAQPQLKPPPLLGVLTHVDLLRPTLEWSPPYDWRQPTKVKEESIHEAVGYARELFRGALVDVVPICTHASGERAWGILEEIVPALASILSEAQSVALLRTFERDLDHDRFRTLLRQIQNCGSGLLKVWAEERLR
jgi:predicted GTPase